MWWARSSKDRLMTPDEAAQRSLELTAQMIETALLELSIYMPDSRMREIDGGYGGFVFKGLAGEAEMGSAGRISAIRGADGQECYSNRRDRVSLNPLMGSIVAARLLDEMRTLIMQCELTRSF